MAPAASFYRDRAPFLPRFCNAFALHFHPSPHLRSHIRTFGTCNSHVQQLPLSALTSNLRLTLDSSPCCCAIENAIFAVVANDYSSSPPPFFPSFSPPLSLTHTRAHTISLSLEPPIDPVASDSRISLAVVYTAIRLLECKLARSNPWVFYSSCTCRTAFLSPAPFVISSTSIFLSVLRIIN